MSVAGSPREVSIDGRPFACSADSDGARSLGGSSNEVQSNGDGITGRIVSTVMPWKLGGLALSIDDDRGDQEFLQDIVDSRRIVDINATFASGAVYAGQGTIVEEIEWSSQSSTAGVTLSGPGKLEKQ
jgi:hypothetical protein